MELKKNRGGTHLITLIVHKSIFSPPTSAASTPRHRSRPKHLFFRENVSPTLSEPTSPKVNCAGRVKQRTVIKQSTESKGDKKRTLARSLTNWCFQSPQDLATGDGDEEEVSGCDLDRWFMAAELAGKEGVKVAVQEKMIEGLVLAPLNALQLMKQRTAPARVGKGEVVGNPKRNSF